MLLNGLIIVALQLFYSVRSQGRTTTNGDACQFPQIYQGNYMEDCFDVRGQESCYVRGLLQECVPLDNGVTTATPNSGSPAASRTTVDGRQCEFPFTYRGQQYTDCAVIGGSEKCGLDNTLVDCVPADGTTAPTSPAPAPTTGTLINVPAAASNRGSPIPSPSSVGINNPAAATNRPSSPTPTPSDTPTPTPTSTPTPDLIRTTEDGKTCEFPFFYRGQVFYDCTIIAQKSQCLIDNNWSVCVPLDTGDQTDQTGVVRSTAIGLCTFPNFYQGTVYNDCFTVGGQQVCEVNGILSECTDAPVAGGPSPSAPDSAPNKVERMTTTGQKCEFPFKFGTKSFNDCINVEGTEFCMKGGAILECQPLSQTPTPTPKVSPTPALTPSPSTPRRKTVTGQDCDLTYTYLGKGYSGCILLDDLEYCEIRGVLFQCEPMDGVMGSPVISSTPTATSPSPRVSRSPTPSPTPTPTKTPARSPTPTPTPSGTPTPDLIRTTKDGKTCEFPFLYRGQVFYDCTTISRKQQCYIDDQWSECLPLDMEINNNDSVVRSTAIGLCTFPNFYQGTVYNDCFTVSGTSVCEVNGILAQCTDTIESTVVQKASPTPTPTSTPTPTPTSTSTPTPDLIRTTEDGKTCEFPFLYRGSVFYDCTTISKKEQCYIDDAWSVCLPLDTASSSNNNNNVVRSTDIGLCTFPNLYQGKVYNDCFTVSGTSVCEVNGRLAECTDSIESSVVLKTNPDSANDNNSGNNDDNGEGSGGGSGLAPGAVAGIVISVLFVVVLATLGVLYYLHLQRKPVQQFVKFDDPVVDGGEEVVANGGDQHLETPTPATAFKPVHVQPEPRTFV